MTPLEISPADLLLRVNWIQKMQAHTGLFLASTQAAERDLEAEISAQGSTPLVAHLRLCGVIPESFEHDCT